MMIIAALEPQQQCSQGASRQEIASYLQQNYHVSTGSRFNTALRSALKSGLNAGIFVFDESTERFKLQNQERALQRKHVESNRKKTAKKSGRHKHKRDKKSHTFDFTFNFNIALDRNEDNPNEDARTQHQHVNTDKMERMTERTVDGGHLTEVHLALVNHIRSTEKHSDLYCLLDHSDLADIQKICEDKVTKMDAEIARNVHHNVLPINVVMPEDIIRHILSFDNVNHHRTVCQQWNRLNQQNEEKMLRDMYQAVDDIEPLVSEMKTVIVHPTRRQLHPLEIRRGYSGPFTSFEHLKGSVRVLVHPGSYPYFRKDLFGQNYTQLIGLTSDCKFEVWGMDFQSYANNSYGDKQHFQNIHITLVGELQLQNLTSGAILFEQCSFEFYDNASLTVGAPDESHPHVFKQCTFQMNDTRCFMIVGSTDVIECQFNGGADLNIQEATAITLMQQNFGPAPNAKVNIKNNAFADFTFGVLLRRPWKFFNTIEITNNRFHNIVQDHIIAVLQNESCDTVIRERCLLQGNKSSGKCSTDSRSNPNKLRTKFED